MSHAYQHCAASVPLVYSFFTALTPACCAVSYPISSSNVPVLPAAANKVMLLSQAVPKPASVEDSATASDQPRDEAAPSANRSGKAKNSQRQKGKGRGSRPVLQPPVLCSVLPCLQKLELHITGGIHCIMLALLCLHY